MEITNVFLSNGRWVNNNLLEVIKKAVADVVPYLVHGARYTLETICGEEIWSNLSNGEKRQAGWCMKHLVITGELPLTIADSKHEYPIYYQLK